MADMVGVHVPPFEKKWPDKVLEMERLLKNYVLSFNSALPGITTDAAAVAAATTETSTPTVNVTNRSIPLGKHTEGYPLLPTAFKASSYTKKLLENLFRRYLSSHYSAYQCVNIVPTIEF